MANETPQMRNARESAERRGENEDTVWPMIDGRPAIKIGAAASELINTGNYSNVTVGPVFVHRWVADGDDEHVKAEVRRTQQVCEQAIAEERETVQALLRSNVAAAAK